jgi:hypothetical protein
MTRAVVVPELPSLADASPSEIAGVGGGGGAVAWKVAVTLESLEPLSWHCCEEPEHDPPQPANTQPSAGVAVRTTVEFAGNWNAQLGGQLMPGGELVTVPLPLT